MLIISIELSHVVQCHVYRHVLFTGPTLHYTAQLYILGPLHTTPHVSFVLKVTTIVYTHTQEQVNGLKCAFMDHILHNLIFISSTLKAGAATNTCTLVHTVHFLSTIKAHIECIHTYSGCDKKPDAKQLI